jgi:hypothetical protein
LGTLASQRWGDMRKVIDNTWQPMQKEFFDNQKNIEEKALLLLKKGYRDEAVKMLTDYTNQCGITAINTAWDTGDYIWTVFDGAW